MTDHTQLLKHRIVCALSILLAFPEDSNANTITIRQVALESLKSATDIYLYALGLEFPNLTMAYLAIMSDGATPAKIFQLDNLTVAFGGK